METTTTEVTVPAIVISVRGMVPSTQVVKDLRKTIKQTNPETGKLFTSKDKLVLGIDPERTITWCPANFAHGDDNRFAEFAKSVGITPSELGATIVMDWFATHKDEIEPVIADRLKEANTTEDLDKKIASAKRQLEKFYQLLATVKK